MVTRPVASKVSARIPHPGDLLRARRPFSEIGDVGYPEAQQVRLKADAFIHVDEIKAKVTQAADLERLIKQHSADIELSLC